MSKIKVLTDSCSDLGKVIRDKYDIGYVRMKTVYEGKETEASLDWEYYSPKELYDLMRGGKRVLTTQVPVEEFQRVFSELLEQGYDIVYVACSSKQSGSVNTGSVVAKELMAKYPDRKIFCIDSLNACMGEGALAVRAAEYRDAGFSAEEIAVASSSFSACEKSSHFSETSVMKSSKLSYPQDISQTKLSISPFSPIVYPIS